MLENASIIVFPLISYCFKLLFSFLITLSLMYLILIALILYLLNSLWNWKQLQLDFHYFRLNSNDKDMIKWRWILNFNMFLYVQVFKIPYLKITLQFNLWQYLKIVLYNWRWNGINGKEKEGDARHFTSYTSIWRWNGGWVFFLHLVQKENRGRGEEMNNIRKWNWIEWKINIFNLFK